MSWAFKSIDNNNRVIVQFTSLSNTKRKILYKYLLLEAKKHCILLYTHNNSLRLKFPIYIIYWNDWMEPSNSIWVRFTWDPFLKTMNKKCITLYVYQSSLWRMKMDKRFLIKILMIVSRDLFSVKFSLRIGPTPTPAAINLSFGFR